MSKGLGKLQRTIVSLLDGSAPLLVHSTTRRKFVTRELLDELQASGALETEDRTLALHTVRRACRTLEERGLIVGHTDVVADRPGPATTSWVLRAQAPRAGRPDPAPIGASMNAAQAACRTEATKRTVTDAELARVAKRVKTLSAKVTVTPANVHALEGDADYERWALASMWHYELQGAAYCQRTGRMALEEWRRLVSKKQGEMTVAERRQLEAFEAWAKQ